jgi:hypothetical protein
MIQDTTVNAPRGESVIASPIKNIVVEIPGNRSNKAILTTTRRL